MAEKKIAVGEKGSRIQESLSFLFFVSKLFGVIPYSLLDFIRKKQFKLSQFGNIQCLLFCIFAVSNYHIITETTILLSGSDSSIGMLTRVIGLFIIYLEPLMMAIDTLAALINQKPLITMFDRLQEIDDKLEKENVLLNYQVITKHSIIFVAIAFVGEVTLAIFNLIVFGDEFLTLSSLWYFVSCVPMFANSVAKTWFLVLILLVQQRLRAINDYLNNTKDVFSEKKLRRVNVNGSNSKRDNLFIENIGFLEREILSGRNSKIKYGNARNWVGSSIMTNKVNDINIFAPKSKGIVNVIPYDPNRKGEKYQFEFD
jgi:ribosomal protein S16